MRALYESLLEVISWKSKPRYDTRSDQYTRIFMPKLFILSSLIMALSHFNDSLNCFVGKKLDKSRQFVQDTCWIQGLYIYPEMHTKLNQSAYYGVPKLVNYDGVNSKGHLCSTLNNAGEINEDCTEMVRRYLLHYQWMSFYVGSLVILYYFPYLVFKFGNADMVSLMDTVRSGNINDVDKIAYNYFNYKINTKQGMIHRVWFNIILKVLFVIVNITGFVFTDYVMDNRFFFYGVNWLKWRKVPNHIAHNIAKRNAPKPGNHLLPSAGFCDIHEALSDKRGIYIDQHKITCEISQNVLYQYIFIILWFFFLLGAIISMIGLLHRLFKIANSLFWIYHPKCFNNQSLSDRIHSQLTMREMEYLEKIRSVNLTFYGELLRELKLYKDDTQAIEQYQRYRGEMVTLLPTAPELRERVD